MFAFLSDGTTTAIISHKFSRTHFRCRVYFPRAYIHRQSTKCLLFSYSHSLLLYLNMRILWVYLCVWCTISAWAAQFVAKKLSTKKQWIAINISTHTHAHTHTCIRTLISHISFYFFPVFSLCQHVAVSNHYITPIHSINQSFRWMCKRVCAPRNSQKYVQSLYLRDDGFLLTARKLYFNSGIVTRHCIIWAPLDFLFMFYLV